MRPAIVSIAVAVAGATAGGLTIGAAPAVAADAIGVSYRAPVPAGWSVTVRDATRSGRVEARSVRLASRGRLSSLDVPPRNAIGLATLELRLRGKDRKRSASQLFDRYVGVPRSASHVRPGRHEPARIVRQRSIAATSTYRFEGRSLYQRNVVTRRGSRMVFVEAISDRSSRSGLRVALERFLAGWRWR